jgi:nitrite reductase (NADH) small subunit/3-phenylpropionate/trans-cinnamate dioxygenase ferredoxin subunit
VPTTATVATVGEILPGTSVVRPVGGRPVAVFNVGGSFYALDDVCPHAGASLADGEVTGLVVACPWHGWRFRLTDGGWADAPKGGVRAGCYRVEVVGDEVRVTVP